MSEKTRLNEFRDKEVQDRLQRLVDGWSGYNLPYVYDELYEIAEIVWEMMDGAIDEEAIESETEEGQAEAGCLSAESV